MNTVLHINGNAVTLEKVDKKSDEIRFTLKGKAYHFRSNRLADGTSILEEELAPGTWQRLAGGTWQSGKNQRSVQVGTLEAKVSETVSGTSASAGEAPLSPLAPMPGLVRQVLVKKGQKVARGEALVVLEAMKLQLTLSAGGDGVVENVLVSAGQLVSEGTELVKLKPGKISDG